MNSETNPTRIIATDYHERGWTVLPIELGSKAPKIRDWAKRTTDDFDPSHFDGPKNIGVVLGAASGGLVDVDLDCRESLILAAQFLPLTMAVFGREGKPRSHWIYVVDEAGPTAKFCDVDGVTMIELRGQGGQTIFPGSTHTTGEAIVWEQDGDQPARVTWGELLLCVKTVAAASILARHWPGVGAKHDARVALCGALIRSGWPESAVEAFARAVCSQGGDRDLDDVTNSIHTTVKRLRASGTATGWPTLAKLLRNDGGKVVTLVRTWLDIAESPHAVDTDDLEVIDDDDAKLTPVADHLLDTFGRVGELARWINQTSLKPQPMFAIANALAAWGAVVGRQVACGRARTNLYCLGVGESGSGKDHSRQAVKRLFEHAGLMKHIGGEDIASDSALLKSVQECPSILFQVDEIGHFFGNAASKYAGMHVRQIAPTFTRLFSSASVVMPGKQYATGERIDLDQPNVCLYGTTVPGRLFDGLSMDEVTDGFLARMLVFRTRDDDPLEEMDASFGDPPGDLVETAAAWRQRNDLPRATGNIASRVSHIPIQVPITAEAKARLRRMVEEARDEKAAAKGSGLAALWARAAEHAAKVALTVASGVAWELERLRVDRDVMDWSCELVSFLVRDFVRSISQSVSSSETERDIQTVMRVIRAGGSQGVTRSDLYRKTRTIRSSARDGAIEYLTTARLIVVEDMAKNSAGRAAVKYVAVKT